jgi:hypothetical protein
MAVDQAGTRREIEEATDQDAWDKLQRRLDGFALPGSTRWAAKQLASYSSDQTLAAAAALDGMSHRRRVKTFRLLSPYVGQELAWLWQDLVDRPYQSGYVRQAFRLPDHPEVTRHSRAHRVSDVADHTNQYARPISWLATWAGHLSSYADLGPLFASAIDHGDTEVLAILLATVDGGHPTARVSRSAIGALLTCADPTAWQAVERLLLSAGRQEGLRQSILEAIDLAHPTAFRRMLGLLLDHDLCRHASVVRAVGTWVAAPFEVRQHELVAEIVASLRSKLEEPDTIEPAIASGEPGEAYLGLWALAAADSAYAALNRAGALLRSGSGLQRFEAARLMRQLQLSRARRDLLDALGDDDLRVATLAAGVLPDETSEVTERQSGVTERHVRLAQRLADRIGDRQSVQLGIWAPESQELTAATLADAVALAVRRDHSLPLTTAREMLPAMSADGRARYVERLAADIDTYAEELLGFAGDRSGHIRDKVFAALATTRLSPERAPALEALLSRRSAGLRTGVIGLLLRQDPPAVRASAARLAAGDAEQQAAAAELRRAIGEAEQRPPDQLVDDARRSPAVRPVPPATDLRRYATGIRLVTTSLAAWLAEHADVEVSLGHGEVKLLGDLKPYELAPPYRGRPDRTMVLPEIFDPWWERTRGQLTDGGVEAAILPLLIALGSGPHIDEAPSGTAWTAKVLAELRPRELRSEAVLPAELRWMIDAVLGWIAYRHARSSWVDVLLDTTQALLAQVPEAAVRGTFTTAQVLRRAYGRDRFADGPVMVVGNAWLPSSGMAAVVDWRGGGLTRWLDKLAWLEQARPDLFTGAHHARLWPMLRFIDEPWGRFDSSRDPYDDVPEEIAARAAAPARLPRQPRRMCPGLRWAAGAYAAGAATDDDLLDLMVRPDVTRLQPVRWGADDPLGELTRRRTPAWLAETPGLAKLADRARDHLVEQEISRGDLPTSGTGRIRAIRSVTGAERAMRLLAALGRRPLARGYMWSAHTQPEALSHLLRVSFPAPEDSAATLVAHARTHKIKDSRLRDLAVYAPQWAPLVEEATGWPGLAEAVHWLHAHTKDDQWSVDQDVREEWEATTARHTGLSARELTNGAVDVAWFQRIVGRLGDERFHALLKSAKYASSAGGHKRAELFARALRGTVTEAELRERIDAKRHQDSVRAYGLLPLPDGEPEQAVLRRYEFLSGFVKSDRTAGAQRRASEQLAVDIGLDNLARTAGYRDPQRLGWAMEAEAVRDLADGRVSVVEDGTEVNLSIDAAGAPSLTVTRAGKPLKSIPKQVAKREPVAELKRRATRLRSQAKRVRDSLEQAMIVGDQLTPDELARLMRHPVLAPQLRTLALVTAEGLLGPPDADGTALRTASGERLPLDGSPIRVAHPLDLLHGGDWPAYQRLLFEAKLRQPFKQVFRELYTLTDAERGDSGRQTAVSSRRYAGHQVRASQALALLRARGWVPDPDYGGNTRTDHRLGITAWLELETPYYTPAEVADPTVEAIHFTRAGATQPLPLTDVPPRFFSEVMRDVDLVVSVAHSGGVDPETSQSTVAMRGDLVRETAELMSLDNVELTGHHVLIRGTLGSYSVHLGSGVVHQRPGNTVCVVPVSAQHRGRLFLPYVDDDPKSAEVVSKVLLLARDDRIKDPTILAQLR